MSGARTLVEHVPVAAGSDAEPGWLARQRRAAAEQFDASSWPTPKLEAWRRTDLSPYDPASWGTAALAPGAGGEAEPIDAGSAAGVIRFRDASPVGSFLRPDLARAGLVLAPLHDVLASGNGAMEAAFERGLASAADKVRLWHYRSWTHGVLVSVPRGVEVDDPLVVELDLAGSTESVPHLVVRLEPGARASVVVRISGAPAGRTVLNGAVDIEVADGASLRYVEAQDLGLESVAFWVAAAAVGRDAKLDHTSAAFGASLHRAELDCTLAAAGAEASLKGVYFARKKQHMDIRIVQRHASPRAASRALYKGAVKDESYSVFQGLIDVAEGASGTDAYLANRNLILDASARADSVPSLAIRNNDLRCSHGSTSGRIDPEERFYLMSRGLDTAEADAMIVEGYFEEIAAEAPEPAAAFLRAGVRRALGAEA
jgi:Fe-S cluster assembly protein SufD